MKSYWSHIILNGFCLYDNLSKKKHVYYRIKNLDTLKRGKKSVEVNKHYISKKERPNWCIKQNKRRVPQYRCLCYGKEKRCPFFGMTNSEKSDYKFLNKKYKKS